MGVMVCRIKGLKIVRSAQSAALMKNGSGFGSKEMVPLPNVVIPTTWLVSGYISNDGHNWMLTTYLNL